LNVFAHFTGNPLTSQSSLEKFNFKISLCLILSYSSKWI
jgi:hypothetical protein